MTTSLGQASTPAQTSARCAANLMKPLDPVCPLVNAIQSVVTIEPLDRVIASIPMPAPNLDRVLVGLETELRPPRFGKKREAAFDTCLLRQQEAFDVGMLDEPDRRRAASLVVREPSLRTLPRVFERVHIRRPGQHQIPMLRREATLHICTVWSGILTLMTWLSRRQSVSFGNGVTVCLCRFP